MAKAWRVLRRVQHHGTRRIRRWVRNGLGRHLSGWICNSFSSAIRYLTGTNLQFIDRGSVTAASYRGEVIQPIVRPFASALGPDFTLRQDNDRAHTARAVTVIAYLNPEEIDVMDWPARSPDMNSIICGTCSIDKFYMVRTHLKTVQTITEVWMEEWNAIRGSGTQSQAAPEHA